MVVCPAWCSPLWSQCKLRQTPATHKHEQNKQIWIMDGCWTDSVCFSVTERNPTCIPSETRQSKLKLYIQKICWHSRSFFLTVKVTCIAARVWAGDHTHILWMYSWWFIASCSACLQKSTKGGTSVGQLLLQTARLGARRCLKAQQSPALILAPVPVNQPPHLLIVTGQTGHPREAEAQFIETLQVSALTL